jgi:hypothetical protein
MNAKRQVAEVVAAPSTSPSDVQEALQAKVKVLETTGGTQPSIFQVGDVHCPLQTLNSCC